MISILRELPPDINTGQDMFLVQFLDTEAGANAIRVGGVVAAHVATEADRPEVGRVGRIRRAQPPVSGFNPSTAVSGIFRRSDAILR